jgi:hypothetical protein
MLYQLYRLGYTALNRRMIVNDELESIQKQSWPIYGITLASAYRL